MNFVSLVVLQLTGYIIWVVARADLRHTCIASWNYSTSVCTVTNAGQFSGIVVYLISVLIKGHGLRAHTCLVVALLCARDKASTNCATLLRKVIVVHILGTGDSCVLRGTGGRKCEN